MRVYLIIAILYTGVLHATSGERITNPDSIGVRSTILAKAAAFTAVYYTTSMFVLGKTWYGDRQVVPFHFYNDNRAYLQMDKLGHAFGSYIYSYLGYRFLKNTGFTKKEALYFGATLGFVLQLPVELMDGFHEGYGFSWGDIAANATGSVLVAGQELLFNDQVVKYKFSYRESPYAGNANGYLGESGFDRLMSDYNGHTYWLSAPVFRLIFTKAPHWLNLALGYSANGMYGEFENLREYQGMAIPDTPRYRQLLLSPDIDWSRIHTNSGFLKILLKGLTFFKMPLPAIEFNPTGRLKGHWLY